MCGLLLKMFVFSWSQWAYGWVPLIELEKDQEMDPGIIGFGLFQWELLTVGKI